MMTIFLTTYNCFSAENGGEDSGGGDSYTLDFISVAVNQVYPWLKENGSKLNPQVDASVFLSHVDPTRVLSKNKVYESCDDSKRGREVEICYNGVKDLFYISRNKYPLNSSDLKLKIGLVSHEIFRRMGIEGNNYEVTRQFGALFFSPENEAKCLELKSRRSGLLAAYEQLQMSCDGRAGSQYTYAGWTSDKSALSRALVADYTEIQKECELRCASQTICNVPLVADICGATH